MRIAMLEAEKEDSANITLFLSLFLETLQKISKNSNLKCQPRGFLVDSAGANFHGIHAVLLGEVCSAHPHASGTSSGVPVIISQKFKRSIR